MATTPDASSRLVPRPLRPVVDIGTERARSRLSAYVYGNILVLAAVLATDGEEIRRGEAVVVLVATMVTTYLAHVLAHDIGERIGRSRAEHRAHLRDELRDALPIITSAVGPGLALAAGALGWLLTQATQILAAAYIVLRLGSLGWVVRRLSREPASSLSVWSGVALAVAGAVVAALKVTLLH